jgi:hypothetical protein
MRKIPWKEKMDKERSSVQKFNRYVLLGQLVSLGLFIMGFFFIIEKEAAVLQAAGGLFMLMGIAFIFIFNRRKRRLLWIYKNTAPVAMNMKLEKIDDSESTNYFAYLTREDRNLPEGWKAGLYAPSFDVQLFLNNAAQVQVYFDPKNNLPAVIKTTQGLLWVMAGSGAVQNLPGS